MTQSKPLRTAAPGFAAETHQPPFPARRRGSYGLDAPYLLPLPLAAVLYNAGNAWVTGRAWPLIPATLLLGCLALGLHASRRGKFVVWQRILDELTLSGDERILDVGCGRGAVLLLAAQRLTTGRAIGIDIWRRGDQSGNAAEATLRNARAEGVADRVEVQTADMTALPFPDGSFDVVVSNIAIHNVSDRARRARAISEIVRVVRPGGRIRIADIQRVEEYRQLLVDLDISDVSATSLGWRMWWTGPWMRTVLVTGTKPHVPAPHP